jgi:hypothetical protein
MWAGEWQAEGDGSDRNGSEVRGESNKRLLVESEHFHG